ncbi:MAG TPA: response regulator [Novimethylophilus sp.]|jgi:CheY-like chemotaxis protein|uniref:response regulator n=1 Tax=Novimethylophilus sp. TaxID=2137426 RepID=UPI002F405D5A
MEQRHLILLVEDNPDDEALTLRAFKKNNIGNEIVVVRNGEEALDFLYARNRYASRDRHQLPLLILLDLKLPKIDGLEVLRHIRAHEDTRHTPVVVLTTSDEDRDLARSYDLGANSFVRKPVNFPEFMDSVKQISMYWLMVNQPPRG